MFLLLNLNVSVPSFKVNSGLRPHNPDKISPISSGSDSILSLNI